MGNTLAELESGTRLLPAPALPGSVTGLIGFFADNWPPATNNKGWGQTQTDLHRPMLKGCLRPRKSRRPTSNTASAR
jgi:hypothetical protein